MTTSAPDSERVLLVVNRAAGGGRAAGVLDSLRGAVPRLADVEILAPTSREALVGELSTRLAERPPERLIVLGGDGTVHLVANLLLEAGRGEIPLGLVPAGTGSDVVRNLGLPSAPAEALVRALEGTPRSIDAIRIERTDDSARRWSVNIASAGISGAVDEAVNRNPERGPTAYLRATLPALWRFRPGPATVRVDGEILYEGPLLLAAFANGRCFGNAMPVAPGAEPDDGLLDVVAVPPIPWWRLPALLPRFLLGRHLGARGVLWARGRRAELEIGRGGPSLDLDGETWPAGPVRFELVPGALRVPG